MGADGIRRNEEHAAGPARGSCARIRGSRPAGAGSFGVAGWESAARGAAARPRQLAETESALQVGTRDVAKQNARDRPGPGEEKVAGRRGSSWIFSAEGDEVFLEDSLDKLAERLADGSAVFMVDDAARLIEHLPTALPAR